MNRRLAFALLALLACGPLCAVEKLAAFKADGAAEELRFLCRDEQSFVDPSCPWEGLFRVVDANRSFVYRFDIADAQVETIRLRIGNSYQISLSTDGVNFTPVLSAGATVGGLANLAWRDIDVAERLQGAPVFYLKSESFDPSQGFGGCLFELELLGSGTMQPPLKAQVAAGKSASSAIAVDGKLAESAWQSAQWAGNFNLVSQAEAPSQPTYFALLYDDENLYIGVKCLDSLVDRMESLIVKRDGDVYRDNAVELFIAPEKPEQTFHFAVNSDGVQFDEIVHKASGAEPVFELDWDANYLAATSKQGDRWELEVAIPWTELRFRPTPGARIGVNVTRNAGAHGELSTWTPLALSLHQPEKFGVAVLAEEFNAPSYAANPAPLSGNPPAWQFMPKEGVMVADPTETVTVRYFPADVKLCPTAPALLTSVQKVALNRPEALLSDTPLPAGNYLVSLDYHSRGVNTYRNLIGVKLAAEDRQALKPELFQRVIQDEEFVTLAYQSRLPDGALVTVRISSGEVPVESVNATVASGAGRVKIPVAHLPLGEYTVAVVLADGSVAGTMPLKKIARTSEPTRFELTEELFLTRDGQPFFPVMMALPQDMESLKRAGFNLVIAGADEDLSEATMALNQQILDEAAANGLFVALHVVNPFRGREDFEILKEIVGRFRNHPALAMWYIADEPTGTATRAATLEKAAAIIRELDDAHPIAGCDNNPFLFGTFGAKAILDIFMPDPYPVPDNDITMVGDWIRRSRSAGKGDVALAPYLQAQGQPFFTRGPNQDELWNMLGQALAEGISGVCWWAHGPALGGGEWDSWPGQIAFIRALEPYIYGVKPAVADAGQVRVSRFESPAGTLVLAVNNGKEPASVQANASELLDGHNGRLVGTQVELAPLGVAAWLE